MFALPPKADVVGLQQARGPMHENSDPIVKGTTYWGTLQLYQGLVQ